MRRRLLTAWTFEADATPSPGYYSTFAAAPIQHIIAAMALNENQTAVALAQTAWKYGKGIGLASVAVTCNQEAIKRQSIGYQGVIKV